MPSEDAARLTLRFDPNTGRIEIVRPDGGTAYILVQGDERVYRYEHLLRRWAATLEREWSDAKERRD